MRQLVTLISALFITAGLKAQSSNVQKETIKPIADKSTSLKDANGAAIKKAEEIKKATAKEAGFKNAAIKNVAFKNTAIKKAAVVEEKATPVKQ